MFKKLSRARVVIISKDTPTGIEVSVRKKGNYSDIGVMLVLAMQLDPAFVDSVRAALMTFDDPGKEKIEFSK